MKQKILVMSFGSDAGGIEKSLIEFLTFLVEEKKEVDLFLWRKPGILYTQIPKEVNIINRKLYPGSLRDLQDEKLLSKLYHVWWYVFFRIMQFIGYPTKAFRKMEGEYDIAVSYCQNGYSPYYVIDKVDAKKKYIWYHHGSYGKCAKEKKRDHIYYKKYDSFITVSNSNKNMLAKEFPVLNDKIEVVKNLINEKMIKDRAMENEEINWGEGYKLVTVGRVASEKGQKLAIEIAKLLKEKQLNFKWVFVGGGPELLECKRKVKAYGLSDLCEFVGEKQNPYPYMKQSDIYVQPSMIEADPITIQEAKILKKVIVASNIGAMRETLEDGKYGKLCELKPEQFAEDIFELINSQEGKIYIDNLEKMESINNISKEKIRKLFKE